MAPTHKTDSVDADGFRAYIDALLARRGWSVNDCSEVSGLSPSVIFRWRTGYAPNIPNARTFARAVGVSVLDVLVASGQLTEDEVGTRHTLDDWTSIELLRAVITRMEDVAVRVESVPRNDEHGERAELAPGRLADLVAAFAAAGKTVQSGAKAGIPEDHEAPPEDGPPGVHSG